MYKFKRFQNYEIKNNQSIIRQLKTINRINGSINEKF